MAIFFIERAILIFANAIIEPFFSRIEQKNALSGYFYKRHPVDYKIFIFLGQPLKYGIEYGKVLHRGLGLEEMQEFFGHTQIKYGEFEYIQPLNRDGLTGRLFSSSYTPAPDHPNYEPMLKRMNEIFDRREVDGLIHFEYDTKVYCGRLP